MKIPKTPEVLILYWIKRNLYIFILINLLFFSCRTQKIKTVPMVHTECDSLFYDLETGMINAVSPVLPPNDIREWFTCFTSVTPDGASKDCGGGVFYENHGFHYYTYFDFIEINHSFKGKVTSNILGAGRPEVKKIMDTVQLYSGKSEYNHIDFYQKPYGCLVLKYKDEKLQKIATYFSECNAIEICEDQPY